MKTKQTSAETLLERLNEKIPINEIYDLDKSDIDDLQDRLWFEIFDPVEQLTKAQRNFLIDQYNIVANKINDLSGFKRVVMLNSSTVVVNDKKQNPNMKKAIYVECKMYDEPKEKKPKPTPPVVDERAAQLFGVEEEGDMMGGDPLNVPDAVVDAAIDQVNDAVIKPRKPKQTKAEKQKALKTKPAKVVPIAKPKTPVTLTRTGDVAKPKPKPVTDDKTKRGNKSNWIAELFAKGKTKDQIIEITGFSRKACTDAIWRYEQSLLKNKKKTK